MCRIQLVVMGLLVCASPSLRAQSVDKVGSADIQRAAQQSTLNDAPMVYLVVKFRTADERSCASLPDRGR